MRIIFTLLLLYFGLEAQPRKKINAIELSVLALATDTTKHLSDLKLIYKKSDRYTNSILEISTAFSILGKKYLFSSDTLLKLKKGIPNLSNIYYTIINSEAVDSLKLQIVDLEKRIFTKEDISSIVFYNLKLDSNITLRLEYFNKPDLYYNLSDGNLELEKGTNVYVPLLMEAIIYFKNRKHIIPYAQFKKIFMSNIE